MAGISPEMASRFWSEVGDATELLDYAVSSGKKAEDGSTLSLEVMAGIKAMNQLLSEAQTKGGLPDLPPVEARVKFEKSYLDLSIFMAPVTAATLRDTSQDEQYYIRSLIGRGSPAKIWNRKMTLWTLLFIAIAIVQNALEIGLGPTPDSADGNAGEKTLDYIQIVLNLLLPFAYGGIGACTYLLKSLHYFIYNRSFDRMREAEYYNRILLGVISGGTITLLISQVTADNGDTITLSASALGFLAGYNTDFLFQAIERIANAILPKVGIDTVKRQTAPAARSVVSLEAVSINDLLQRYSSAATEQEKTMIAALIQRLSDRI